MNKTICTLFVLFAVASANTFENLEFSDDTVVVNEDIEFPAVKGVFDCVTSVAQIIPALNTLIKDAKAKKGVQTLIGDLQAVIGKIDSICDSCKIPKPKSKSGKPINLQACAADAANIANDAADVIKNAKNPLKIVSSLSRLISKIPDALADCGIRK